MIFDKIRMFYRLNKQWLSELELYKSIFTLSVDAKCIIEDNKFVKFNRSFDNLFRYPLEKLRDADIESLFGMSSDKINKEYITNIKNNDGEVIPVLITSVVITINKKDRLFITIKDISSAKMSENRINIFTKASNEITDGIIITDNNGYIQWANNVIIEEFGHTLEELVGKKTSIFKSDLIEKEVYDELWQNILNGKVWTGYLVNKTKKCSTKLVHLTIIPMYVDKELVNFISIQKLQPSETVIEHGRGEEDLKSLFENMEVGFIIQEVKKNKAGKISKLITVHANKFATDLYSKYGIFIKNSKMEDDKFLFHFIESILDSSITNGYQINTKDGKIFKRQNFKLTDTKIISLIEII